MKLKDWFTFADEYHKTAQYLEDPRIEIIQKVPVRLSSWFLLHHALELYLKGILINYDKFGSKNTQIHDIKKLSDKVVTLNIRIDESLAQKRDNRTIKQWLYFINPFGFPGGGLRYPHNKSSIYAAPLGISYYFSDLIKIIKAECSLDKTFTLPDY